MLMLIKKKKLTYLKKHINHKKNLMVCGHNLPTVVFNYGQSQNNQAMQTTISNATIMIGFLSEMGNRDITSKQKKHRFSIHRQPKTTA